MTDSTLTMIGKRDGSFLLVRETEPRRLMSLSDAEAVSLAECLLSRIDQGNAMGIVLRWVYGKKPSPPSMLPKPDPHLVRTSHGPKPPVDSGK